MKGLISLGGGLPSSAYFPFERLDVKVPKPPHFSEEETKKSGILSTAGKHDFAEGKSIYGLSWSQCVLRGYRTERTDRYAYCVQLRASVWLSAATSFRYGAYRGKCFEFIFSYRLPARKDSSVSLKLYKNEFTLWRWALQPSKPINRMGIRYGRYYGFKYP